MKVFAGLVVLGLLTLASVIACVGEDPALSGATATDAGATDGTTAAPSAPQAEGAADAGSTADNVLRRGDFETSGCLGWTANEATLTADPDKHGGSFACRVCASGSTSVWGIFQDLPSVEAGSYVSRGFVRASGDAGPFAAVLRLETFADEQQDRPSREGQATIAPGEGWEEVTTEIEVEPGKKVAVAVLSSSPGGCFLVDDVTLVKR